MLQILPLLVLAVVPDPAIWEKLLQSFVLENGLVRYGALQKAELQKDSAALTGYVEAIGRVSPDSHPALFPSRAAKLAYWINTYNALVIHSMATEYPASKGRLSGLLGRANYFYRRKFTVGGKSRSLDDIETNSIRSAGDPRIHFAIVCASKGCPWLARTAYTEQNLEGLLEARTKFYFSRAEQFAVDKTEKTIMASSVFVWFKKDFGGQPLRFIERYAGPLPGYRLQERPWDWSLNDAP